MESPKPSRRTRKEKELQTIKGSKGILEKFMLSREPLWKSMKNRLAIKKTLDGQRTLQTSKSGAINPKEIEEEQPRDSIMSKINMIQKQLKASKESRLERQSLGYLTRKKKNELLSKEELANIKDILLTPKTISKIVNISKKYLPGQSRNSQFTEQLAGTGAVSRPPKTASQTTSPSKDFKFKVKRGSESKKRSTSEKRRRINTEGINV